MVVNFRRIVTSLKKSGAFLEYSDGKAPKAGPEIPAEDRTGGYFPPAHPGKKVYGSGWTVLNIHKKDIPQSAVDAQRISMLHAIELYMPGEHFVPWTHQFFSGDFLGATRKHVLSYDFAFDASAHDKLDSALTMQLDSPERKAKSGKLIFTEEEHQIVARVCQKHPEIMATVLAFQSCAVEYTVQLEKAVRHHDKIDERERSKGKTACESLAEPWRKGNFIHNILPAVCLAYEKNHGPNSDDKPTEKDFVDGMKYTAKNGMFNREMSAPGCEPRQFACPAQRIINRASMLKLKLKGKEAAAEPEVKEDKDSLGTGLYHIFREAEKQPAKAAELLELILKPKKERTGSDRLKPPAPEDQIELY